MFAIIINVVAFAVICLLALSSDAGVTQNNGSSTYFVSFSPKVLSKRLQSIKMYVKRILSKL